MSDPVWKCLYQSEGLVEKRHELWSTVLEFILIAVVIFCGVALNYRFFDKLKVERRRRPPGRKGNVIEPIVSLFCIFQIIYWPCNVLYFWLFSNEVVKIDDLSGWWPNILIQLIRMGRLYIGWNSLFVALIRYIYIVHREKSNQWEFDNVGRIFSILSFAVPALVELIGVFTHNWLEFQNNVKDQDWLKDCIASNLNKTASDIEIPYPTYPLKWTMMFLPEEMISLLWYIWLFWSILPQSCVPEVFLYSRIFLNIKRSDKEQLEIGVYNEEQYDQCRKRSIISLQMCFWGWLYELLSYILLIIRPILKHKYGFTNTYFCDIVMWFVVIPFLHILNDDDTKEIISQESWLHGLKFMFGIYKPRPENNPPN